MVAMNRREFVAAAAALGATAAWAGGARSSRLAWREDRAHFSEGVASADPRPDSVLLWTRCSESGAQAVRLRVEIASDPSFDRVVATASARALAASDWTCRVLVGGLVPNT